MPAPTPVSPVPASYSGPVPALTRWGAEGAGQAPTVSYSFAQSGSLWDYQNAYTQPGQPTLGFAPFTTELQAATRAVLADWSAICGLRFVETADDASGHGDLRYAFTQYNMSATQLGAAFLPNASDNGGDVWLNASKANEQFASLAPGTLGYFTILHETGHALGLRHPDTPLSEGGNSIFQSVMSVNAWPGTALTYSGNIDRFPSTPMSWDIDAMRLLYGANLNTAGDDTVYPFDTLGRYLMTVFDTGGIDTLRVDGTFGAVIDLRPGSWSRIGLPVQVDNGRTIAPDTVQIYRDSWIENAVGTDGPDLITGNAVDNRLEGRGGDDRIDGGEGLDRVVFGGLRSQSTWRWDATSLLVTGPEAQGVDSLVNVERLVFVDRVVAFDVQANQGAGRAALLAAGLLGPAALSDAALMKTLTAYFDSGKGLLDAAVLLAGGSVLAELAGGTGHSALVRLLYRNVTGVAEPTTAQIAPYVAMLDAGRYSVPEFVAQAVALDLLAVRIDLAGLALRGLELSA